MSSTLFDAAGAAMPSAADIYSRAARAGARPDPNLKVSEWADKHRILTTRSSPEPGPWRTSRAPFLKDIMDDLSPFSRCEQVVFMKGSQIGGTECGNNWIGFVIHLAPGPMMAVQPTTEMAKRNSKQRIAPLIEDSPALRNLVKESRSRDSGNTQLAKEYPGGILVMVGANSAKGLRSMSARYLFLDEVDGYPGDCDGEGEPCQLAIARTTNYARRKIFICSTPVISGRSRIERFYNESDQRQYWVPCPFCAEMQVLRFENLRWPKRNPDAAHYHCESCGRSIADHAKNFMLPRGEWRPQQVNDGKVHGYHLSSLYSPVGWLSWAQIAKRYDEAQGDREKLQVFQNTVLGQPWTDVGEVPDTDRLYERREKYDIGKVPQGGLLLTAGCDVQLKRLEVEIVAWGRNKQSWSVDYRVFEGDTTQPAVWAQLAALLDEDFPTVYGQPLRIAKMAVDSGFNTTTVYDFVRKMSAQRVMAVKGDSRVSSPGGRALADRSGAARAVALRHPAMAVEYFHRQGRAVSVVAVERAGSRERRAVASWILPFPAVFARVFRATHRRAARDEDGRRDAPHRLGEAARSQRGARCEAVRPRRGGEPAHGNLGGPAMGRHPGQPDGGARSAAIGHKGNQHDDADAGLPADPREGQFSRRLRLL